MTTTAEEATAADVRLHFRVHDTGIGIASRQQRRIFEAFMPEMDGLEATAAIRARERTTGRHVPIVALTAHVMDTDRQHCRQAGLDGYLSKPIHLQKLRETVEQFL